MSKEIFTFEALNNLTLTHGVICAEVDDTPEEEKPKKLPPQSKIFGQSHHNHPLAIKPVLTSSSTMAMKGKDPALIAPPFLMILLAPVRGGKSTLLVNLVYQKNYYAKMFKRIYLLSPSAELDPTLSIFHEDENCISSAVKCSDELNERVESIIEEQESDLEPALIILDDCAALLRNGDAISGLATRYRHLKLSIIITSQYMMKLVPTIRTNATAIILFSLINSKERDAFIEEYRASFGDRLITTYKQVFEDPERKYQFLVLNLRNRTIYDSFIKLL